MHADWYPVFLAALSECPNVTAACRLAGIGRQTAYSAKEVDPDFAQAWADALDASTDDLVAEAYRRARHGTDKPVFHQGEECGRIREYSDTLAIFLLKAHRPEVYRESIKQEISGPNNGPIAITSEARGEAGSELTEWRQQQIVGLSSMQSPSPTAPTS